MYVYMNIFFYSLLGEIPWVATTADCWANHHKSYIGATIHWLDPTTRERKMAVLTVARLKGSHTYDVIAKAISDIHGRFHLHEKVRRTTTDNASNFVKAFSHFGLESDTVAEAAAEEAEAAAEDPPELEDFLADEEAVAAEEVLPEAVDVQDLLGRDDEGEVNNILPAHMRCAAHTFNLVATADASKAMEDHRFKTPFRYIYNLILFPILSKCSSFFSPLLLILKKISSLKKI